MHHPRVALVQRAEGNPVAVLRRPHQCLIGGLGPSLLAGVQLTQFVESHLPRCSHILTLTCFCAALPNGQDGLALSSVSNKSRPRPRSSLRGYPVAGSGAVTYIGGMPR